MTPFVRMAAGSLLVLSVLASCGSASEVDESAASTTATTTADGARPAAAGADREAIDSGWSGSSLEETTDAVHPAIAALPFAERVEEVGRVEVAGQVCVLSKLPASTAQRFIDKGLAGPHLDPSGGEVLHLDGELIVHSVPMNASPPSFIEANDSVVYAGRHGDGGYPDSALIGIDLTSGRVNRLVFPAGDSPDPDPGPEWMLGTDVQLEQFTRGNYERVFS